jgi:glycosyltransferase involved in cell wall biosynthesis
MQNILTIAVGEPRQRPRPGEGRMISVVIPACNEEQTVGDVVRGVRGALCAMASVAEPVEVIVVDGGSTDATARMAEIAGATTLRRPYEGKGLAVRAGLAAARGEILVLMDSDGQDLPSELPSLLRAFMSSGADFVNGSRFMGTFCEEGISLVDRWGNRALTGLANLLCGTHLSDINASYRVVRRSAVAGFGWRFEQFEGESEMILKAARAGLEILEVPITRERRLGGVRKFRKLRHGLRILLAILRTRFLWRPPALPSS